MTQPPLTQAIQSLERRLGVLLFERTRRSVRLSAAGATLLDAARRLLVDAAALPSAVQAAARGDSGRLRLAFVSSVAYWPLPQWLRGFREAHPGVRLELREATLNVQTAASFASHFFTVFKEITTPRLSDFLRCEPSEAREPILRAYFIIGKAIL